MKQHDGFIKNSDVNVLLAGGGHKPLSEIMDWDNISNKSVYTTRWPTWDEVSSKPSTFPPDSHLHYWANILTSTTANDTTTPTFGRNITFKSSSANALVILNFQEYYTGSTNWTALFICDYYGTNAFVFKAGREYPFEHFLFRRTNDAPIFDISSSGTTSWFRTTIKNDLVVDASNIGDDRGIFFRDGFVDSNKYNCSIMVHDHNGNFPDGLSINAYDGISFCTGSNDRLERMRINLNGLVGIGRVADGYILDVQGNTRIYSSRFRWSNWDACLDIYGTETCCGPENVAFQTTFDNRSAVDEHDYTSWYPSRAAIVLLPNGGRVGVNVLHDPSYTLHVNGACAATSFPNISDIRKKNIMSEVNLSLESIYSAPIFKFTWNDPKLEKRIQIGSSALYWRNIIPEATTQAEDDIGTLSMQYDVIALASVITLAKELRKCKERILELENKINTN